MGLCVQTDLINLVDLVNLVNLLLSVRNTHKQLENTHIYCASLGNAP